MSEPVRQTLAAEALVERVLEVGGARNVRDLGGLVGADGRVVRHGLVLRSDSLCQLDDAGLTALAEYGVRTVIDLRDHAEIAANGPDRLPAGTTALHFEVLGLTPGVDTGREALARLLAEGGATEAMRSVYGTLVVKAQARAAWGEILRLLADDAAGPALFHCTAGKDRTGVLAAILLRALGVDDEAILEDYLRSNDAFGDGWPEGFDKVLARVPDPGPLRPLVRVERQYLTAAVTAMTEAYGDFDTYLRDGLDLDDTTLERLRDRLLD